MAFLSFLRQGGGKYRSVYVTTAHWGVSSTGRRGAQQERSYVGRVDLSGEFVHLTKGLVGGQKVRVSLAELKRRVQAGEDVQAWFRTLVGSASTVAVKSRQTAGVTGDISTALLGLPHVFNTLAESTGLRLALVAAFGAERGVALLYLAMHQAARGEPLYLAQAWLDDLWLPPELAETDFSSPGLSGLMAEVGRDIAGQQKFFKNWLNAQGKPSALIYDTTSISTYSASLEAAAYGYNRDGDSLPQVNLALVCARETGMPLFIRTLPGSVPDVSTLANTTACLRELGLQEFHCVLDRGFHSNSNLRGLLWKKLHFTVGALLFNKQSKALLRRHRAALNSAKRSIYVDGRCLRHVQDEWRVDMGKDKDGHKVPDQIIAAHLYYDPRRHADRVAEIEERVFALEAKAAQETFTTWREAAAWRAENCGFTARCLKIEPAGEGIFLLRRRPNTIAAMTANVGYQLILRDDLETGAVEVIGDYRHRDRVEKLFDILKNENDQARLRTGIHEVAEGRVLLSFLAMALHAAVEGRLRQGGLLKNVSVAEFLAEIGKIRALRFKSGTRLVREVTKRQRQWLDAADLPPVDPLPA